MGIGRAEKSAFLYPFPRTGVAGRWVAQEAKIAARYVAEEGNYRRNVHWGEENLRREISATLERRSSKGTVIRRSNSALCEALLPNFLQGVDADFAASQVCKPGQLGREFGASQDHAAMLKHCAATTALGAAGHFVGANEQVAGQVALEAEK